MLARASMIAANPAGWQRAIHGHETILRECVTHALAKSASAKSAFRYAACGLGDQMVKDKKGIHVAPLGCGHRLCPRCGRTKGGPMIKRIMTWLGYADHGDIFTMCLTQRVQSGEPLAAARKRMVKHEQEYLRWLKDEGMVSGASCAHPVWSQSSQGWHYHVHLLIEMPAAWRDSRGRPMTPRRLRAMYRLLRWGHDVQARKESSSRVVSAGPADVALADGSTDPDFWTESKSGLAAAVQYPVRDIAQGISAKRMGGDREQVAACVEELLKHAKGWKLRRTFGQWRKKPPERPQAATAAPERVVPEAEKAVSAASPPGAAKVQVFGTVHRCSRQAARGDKLSQLLFVALESSCRNDTDFGKRFVSFCRQAACRGVT